MKKQTINVGEGKLKASFLTMAILAIGLCFTSCEKEDLNIDSETHDNTGSNLKSLSLPINVLNEPHVINGRLVFRDADQFEFNLQLLNSLDITDELLNFWENKFKYTSLREYVKSKGNYWTNSDDIIGTILNKDSIVQIGEIVAMPSISEQTLYYINSIDAENHLDDLINKQISSVVHTIKFDDEDAIAGLFGIKIRIGCGESSRSGKESNFYTNAVYDDENELNYRIHVRFKNRNFGLYHDWFFNMNMQVYHNNQWRAVYDGKGGQFMEPESFQVELIDLHSKVKKRCRNEEEKYDAYKVWSKSTLNEEFVKTWYSSMRGLHKIYGQVHVKFNISRNNIPQIFYSHKDNY